VPRQNRRRIDDAAAPELRTFGERREQWRGEDYAVRSVSAAGAVKAYRCPGCDQELRPGVPHLVAWPEHDTDATHRSHWHTVCWGARDRRAPGVQRGRSAPRY
jgi:hypothetical protein